MTAAEHPSTSVAESVSFDLYRQAIDEIFALRQALAYESCVIEAHLDYKMFPKSRRGIARVQVERMRRSAQGNVLRAYAIKPHGVLRNALLEA